MSLPNRNSIKSDLVTLIRELGTVSPGEAYVALAAKWDLTPEEHAQMRGNRRSPPEASQLHVAADWLPVMRNHLKAILSSVLVVEHALLEQAVELDLDAARVLRVHVGDPLYEQTEVIGRLLGEDDGGAV